MDLALSRLKECSQGLFTEQESGDIAANEENCVSAVACSKMTKEMECLQKPVSVFSVRLPTRKRNSSSSAAQSVF